MEQAERNPSGGTGRPFELSQEVVLGILQKHPRLQSLNVTNSVCSLTLLTAPAPD